MRPKTWTQTHTFKKVQKVMSNYIYVHLGKIWSTDWLRFERRSSAIRPVLMSSYVGKIKLNNTSMVYTHT